MYVLLQFEADGSKNKEFNTTLDHNTNVLAYLTTRIEKEELIEEIKSLDSQLGLLNKDENSVKNDNEVKEEISETKDNEDVEEVIENQEDK